MFKVCSKEVDKYGLTTRGNQVVSMKDLKLMKLHPQKNGSLTLYFFLVLSSLLASMQMFLSCHAQQGASYGKEQGPSSSQDDHGFWHFMLFHFASVTIR
jgi:hypothetical protein